MSSTSRKSKDNGNTQFVESTLLITESPKIIERRKKFAAYDKNGRLIILGYNRKIVLEYADAQTKLRPKRQRKD